MKSTRLIAHLHVSRSLKTMNAKPNIHFVSRAFLIMTLFLCCSCGKKTGSKTTNPESARRELAALGKQFRPIDFITAAKDADVIVVDLFLKCGMNVNTVEGDLTPLITAATFSGTPQIIDLLVKNGADVNFTTSTGNTPLIAVLSRPAESGSANDRLKIVESLLNAGANVNAQDSNGSTPLLKAIMKGSVETTKLLLEKGADTRLTAKHGISPVFLATTMKRPDLVKVLLNYGAFVGRYNSEGEHALKAAERMNHHELISLLKPALDAQLKQHLGKAERGDVTSMFYVSRAWLMGDFGKPDDAQFFKWIERAALAGDVDSQTEVGICYLNAVGVKKTRASDVSGCGRLWVSGVRGLPIFSRKSVKPSMRSFCCLFIEPWDKLSVKNRSEPMKSISKFWIRWSRNMHRTSSTRVTSLSFSALFSRWLETKAGR